MSGNNQTYGVYEHKVFALPDDTQTFGVYEYISRQHAVLVKIGNATVLLDLKSRNETFVNGKRVDNQVLINDDVISIGDHRIKFLDPAMTSRDKLPKEASDATTIAKALRETTRNLLKGVGS